MAADQRDLWLERLFAAQSNVQTWAAEVVQTRSLAVLAQPLVATGQVQVALPDRFRWELGQPAQTIALRQRDQLWVIYPRLKRAEKYPLNAKQPGPWRDALALLESAFPRSRAEMEAQFRLRSVEQTNGLLQVRLEPRSAPARRMMPEIQVRFRTNDFSLVSNEVKFMDGSTMRNEYRNPRVNPPLTEQDFDPKLPKDFTVVDPFHR